MPRPFSLPKLRRISVGQHQPAQQTGVLRGKHQPFQQQRTVAADPNFSCNNQGIQAGWVDEYGAGLDCQWIDITDIEIEGNDYGITAQLPLQHRAIFVRGLPGAGRRRQSRF
ncbi:MAG: hypothetical protein H6656_01410 [Ardenticatenaceae bacterium]|nr:hypothetical protein [Ardenticatenaceae bacterium]